MLLPLVVHAVCQYRSTIVRQYLTARRRVVVGAVCQYRSRVVANAVGSTGLRVGGCRVAATSTTLLVLAPYAMPVQPSWYLCTPPIW
eukprot:1477282-Rhodomonas_salina.2